jgi:hypothetical protein
MVLRVQVWQLVLGLLAEVVPQEQAPHGVLDALAHLHQVEQDVLGGRFLAADEHSAHGDEEVQAGEDVAGLLHHLVQLRHGRAVAMHRHEEHLQEAQVIKHRRVCAPQQQVGHTGECMGGRGGG